ncbi:MAG TPA: BON domain-containing protein [Nevskia sp.]|nr:BON domain-containing protein [Nevskia sp.]
MVTNSRKLMLASGIVLTLTAMSSAVAAQSTSQDLADARQETQIWTTYALNPYLRANDLKVSVHSGRATLSGKVEDGVDKDLARQIALGVAGIKDVDNQIVVEPDYLPPAPVTADRTYGTVIDDASISAAIKSKLLWSKYTDGLATDVDTNSGKVTLKGTADTAQAKDLAGHMAMNTRGVVAVDNQLVVARAKPTVAASVKTAAHEAGSDIADSWITTKVKSTFLYSSNVNGADIGVSTSNGVVTLSGKVKSGAERALAIELAKNVRGVARVHAAGLTI